MLLETLFLRDPYAQTYSESIEYSPPKDAIDSAMFNTYFNDGSYPLAGQIAEEQREDTQIMMDIEAAEKAELASTSDSQEMDKKSDAGSQRTCAGTATSRSNMSPKVNIQKRQLSKRGPEMSETNSSIKFHLSGSISPSHERTAHFQEKDILINSEISNQKMAWLSIRVIDRTSSILEEEWESLSYQDQSVLVSYMENIYGVHLKSKQGITALEKINNLVDSPPKAKRNEEKLKKTAKKINSMIANTFVAINNLHHFTEEELEEIIFSAYFGQMAYESNAINIFSSKLAFSQKAFARILENHRYAEDFETVLNTSYIPEFIKCRQEKVLRSICFLKKKMFTNQDQIENAISNDLIRRAPWSLSEILEGVNLCQSLINRSKIC